MTKAESMSDTRLGYSQTDIPYTCERIDSVSQKFTCSFRHRSAGQADELRAVEGSCRRESVDGGRSRGILAINPRTTTEDAAEAVNLPHFPSFSLYSPKCIWQHLQFSIPLPFLPTATLRHLFGLKTKHGSSTSVTWFHYSRGYISFISYFIHFADVQTLETSSIDEQSSILSPHSVPGRSFGQGRNVVLGAVQCRRGSLGSQTSKRRLLIKPREAVLSGDLQGFVQDEGAISGSVGTDAHYQSDAYLVPCPMPYPSIIFVFTYNIFTTSPFPPFLSPSPSPSSPFLSPSPSTIFSFSFSFAIHHLLFFLLRHPPSPFLSPSPSTISFSFSFAIHHLLFFLLRHPPSSPFFLLRHHHLLFFLLRHPPSSPFLSPSPSTIFSFSFSFAIHHLLLFFLLRHPPSSPFLSPSPSTISHSSFPSSCEEKAFKLFAVQSFSSFFIPANQSHSRSRGA
ncbi:hypothetical protein C7M84_020660 [Penaeus vannamei]|uniref:Uncharacterized protein n=1 Tax=Penaeus vannamei TaxID=6689 RepID=A0A3R7P566_PENVA|nr:hypothetical protein C7M84_020660 [Penaeus vannamei]